MDVGAGIGSPKNVMENDEGNMEIHFTSPLEHQPGIIATLLKQSYAGLLDVDPDPWSMEEAKWEEYDGEVFQYPDTVGACIFLTWKKNQLIGFGSYDPRLRPASGRIGHNCILPEFRGKGFGKIQIMEIVRRLTAFDIKTVRVSTCSHPFFTAAQRMYIGCGFVETRRLPPQIDPRDELIEYEKNLSIK
jgi:GNAT superfamily N-acetyltransferase